MQNMVIYALQVLLSVQIDSVHGQRNLDDTREVNEREREGKHLESDNEDPQRDPLPLIPSIGGITNKGDKCADHNDDI